MATKSELISDIELRLAGGAISDDFEIDRRQISHWIDIIRDALVSNQLTNDIQQAKRRGHRVMINPSLLTKIECTSASRETTACDDGDEYVRFEITLPNDVLKLPDDMGVAYVTNNAGERLIRTSEDELQMLENLPFSKPSPENQMFYRDTALTLIIPGITKSQADFVRFNVYVVDKMSGKDDHVSTNWTSEYPITSDLEAVLLDEVEGMALRELGIEEDVFNDGQDN